MTGMLLNFAGPDFVVPQVAPSDLAVAANFERFDGLTLPTTNPVTGDGDSAVYAFGPDHYGASPTPGRADTPVREQTYTPGPLRGTVGVVGGQPLPTSDRIHRGPGTVQLVSEYNTQHRLGVGQAYQGIAQTVQLQAITDNPPEPAGMTAILGGWG